MSKNMQKVRPRERSLILDALTNAANGMKGDDAIERFLAELLTESERITIGRRILIAQMILAGKTQIEIRAELNISPNTYTRTRRWLEGQLPNYEDALKAYAAEHKKKVSSHESYPPAFSFAALQKKYPMHFLLFTVAEEIFKKR